MNREHIPRAGMVVVVAAAAAVCCAGGPRAATARGTAARRRHPPVHWQAVIDYHHGLLADARQRAAPGSPDRPALSFGRGLRHM